MKWYDLNSRDLPWRQTTDPYKIWLSEIILQQTRVNQGTPYYFRFVEKYPDIGALAASSEQEVLRLWQGLGYYSRARNLHACAKILMDKYGGVFPKSYKEIIKLPGIGKYTAAAIASFAFKEVVPVIDGNVFRVLSRLYGIDKDILLGKSRKTFEDIAANLISKKHPDTFNQALMEFGSLQCKPQNPDCESCPLALECFARTTGRQHDFPVKVKKLKVRTRHLVYLVINKNDTIWMKSRPKGDIWQGLFDFYVLDDNSAGIEGADEIINTALQTLNVTKEETSFELSREYKHVLTHQIIFARFLMVSLNTNNFKLGNGGGFYSPEEIKELPKPVLVSTYLKEAIF